MTGADLHDERSFLLASLQDLERERAAGDVSPADYEMLRDRYTRRAAEVLRAIEGATAIDDAPGGDDVGGGSAPPSPGRRRWTGGWTGRRRRRRPALAVTGVALVVAGVATWAVLRQTSSQLPGEPITGSVHLTPAEQEHQTLLQAETEEAEGAGPVALALFQQVLARQPTLAEEVEALAESGWIEFQAGVAAKSSALLTEAQEVEQRAVAADPGAYAPHLYLGSMLLTEASPLAAVDQFRLFLGDRPPVATVQKAEPFIERAFADAHLPVPPLPPLPPLPSA